MISRVSLKKEGGLDLGPSHGPRVPIASGKKTVGLASSSTVDTGLEPQLGDMGRKALDPTDRFSACLEN